MSIKNYNVIHDGVVVEASGGFPTSHASTHKTSGSDPVDHSDLFTDYLIQVSSDFVANDNYNIYPTIVAGLARANALVSGGVPLVEVRVRPGYYEEEGLEVQSGVVLSMDPGSSLVGPSGGASTYLLRASGTGRLKNVLVIPQSNGPTGVGVIQIAPDQNNTIHENIIAVVLWKTGWDAVCKVEDVTGHESVLMFNLVFTSLPVGTALLNVGGGGITYYKGIFSGERSLKTINGLVGSTQEIGLFEFCEFAGPVELDTYAIINCGGTTPLDLSTAILPDGLNQVVYLPRATQMEQSVYPDPLVVGPPRGLVNNALVKINDVTNGLILDVGQLRDNLGILITEVQMESDVSSGNYEGLLVETFGSDLSGIDQSSGKTEGVILNGDGIAIFGEDVTIDNFEGYANTSALRTVWSEYPNSLNLSINLMDSGGAVGSGKHMQITLDNNNASGVAVRRTPSSSDFSDQAEIFFYARGDGSAIGPNHFLRLRDNLGNTIVSPGFKVSAVWELKRIKFTADFRYHDIAYIEIVVGTVTGSGNIYIDDIWVENIETFYQEGIISDWNDVTEVNTWTEDGGVVASFSTADPYSGAGNILLTSMPSGTWSISKTFASPLAISKHTTIAARMRYRWDSTPAGSNLRLRLEFEDGSGNVIWFPGYTIDRVNDTVQLEIRPNVKRWETVEFFFTDYSFTNGSAFDWDDIRGVKIFNSISPSPTGDLHLDLLEFGRPSTIESTELDITGSVFTRSKPHASYSSRGEVDIFGILYDGVENRIELNFSAPATPFNRNLPLSDEEVHFACYDAQIRRLGSPPNPGPDGTYGEFLDVTPDASLTVKYRFYSRLRMKSGGITVIWD